MNQTHFLRTISLSVLATAVIGMVIAPVGVFAADDESGDAPHGATDLAENPIASVVSLPIQNNTYFNTGPDKGTANGLLIEPVVPFHISDDWDLISRTIIPIDSLPSISSGDGATTGLGNIVEQLYFTPAHPGSILWGAGPELWLPTATNSRLGMNHWGGGFDSVVLAIRGSWLVGTLVSNAWAGSGSNRENEMTINPFVNYNMPHGWYLASTPVITSNWVANHNQRWTVPVGGGGGRVFKIGKQLVNLRSELFYNVDHPDHSANWQLQFQAQFLFPEH